MLIQATVAPDTWRENGGTYGAYRVLYDQLIVTQSEENHRAIANLLEQIRAVQTLNLRVRAHWVLVSDRTSLDQILKPATATGRLVMTLGDTATRPSERV